jgi:acyl dehydratase
MTMNHEQGLFLDDLYVGQRFTSGTYRIDEERIKSFAAEFDPQLFHLDEAAAQGSVFGGLAQAIRGMIRYKRSNQSSEAQDIEQVLPRLRERLRQHFARAFQ